METAHWCVGHCENAFLCYPAVLRLHESPVCVLSTCITTVMVRGWEIQTNLFPMAICRGSSYKKNFYFEEKQDVTAHTAGRTAIQQKLWLHLTSANISIFLSFHSLPAQFHGPQETTLPSKAISRSGNCACKTPSGHASATSPTPQSEYI